MVWYDTRVNPNQYQVWGRIVRYAGGGPPEFVTGDFFIGAPAGGANGELGLDVAYSLSSRRFLVAYNQIGPPTADIVAQLVDNVGNLVGGPQPLSLDDHWQREPSIAYDTRTDNFMVAWGVFYNPAGPGAVHVRTVSASTGALGPVREVATGSAVYVPQVEFNLVTGHFFVAWYTQPSIWGRTLAPDGTPVTNTSLVAYNYASYDGLGLAYNPVANAYFAIFHGRGSEDVGAQVSAAGVPDVEFTVTATPGIAGNYNPRVTSHNESRRVARRHLVELRPGDRPARAVRRRRTAAPATTATTAATPAAAAADGHRADRRRTSRTAAGSSPKGRHRPRQTGSSRSTWSRTRTRRTSPCGSSTPATMAGWS